MAAFQPKDFAACARCGSGRVHPKLLMMGPIAGIDSDSRSYVCHACGHEGLPIFFDTLEQRAQFEREKQGIWGPESPPRSKEALSIPILPIQTDPLIDLKILELFPIRVATVTSVRWDGRALEPTAYRVSFQEYWDAIGGPRYNASRVFMLDLSGINRANPNFDVTRHLVKRCDVWLDSGGRDPDEVMDGYMLDAQRVVAGSKTLSSFQAFEELHQLSSDVLPCLDTDGRVVWADPHESLVDLGDVLRNLRRVGFTSVSVMDLRRLGSELGPDPGLVASLEGVDMEVYLGGGVRETDVPALAERGLAGGLVDPYTPVIRDLLRPPRKEEPTSATAPAPTRQRAPSPGYVPEPG